jgi:hypothetical protein
MVVVMVVVVRGGGTNSLPCCFASKLHSEYTPASNVVTEPLNVMDMLSVVGSQVRSMPEGKPAVLTVPRRSGVPEHVDVSMSTNPMPMLGCPITVKEMVAKAPTADVGNSANTAANTIIVILTRMSNVRPPNVHSKMGTSGGGGVVVVVVAAVVVVMVVVVVVAR